MHKSIQDILNRTKPTPPKSFAWEWISEHFDENHDNESSCHGCEWNWGQSCRLLHAAGPNDPEFCSDYEKFLTQGEAE